MIVRNSQFQERSPKLKIFLFIKFQHIRLAHSATNLIHFYTFELEKSIFDMVVCDYVLCMQLAEVVNTWTLPIPCNASAGTQRRKLVAGSAPTLASPGPRGQLTG